MAPKGNKGNKKSEPTDNPEYLEKRKRNNEVKKLL
jgi:hypothetical protein